ncbi:MAG: phage tail assembly chaperone G [Anaerolineae bacterium]
MAVITLNLYDNDNEIKGTYTRAFIPWKVLKRAVKLVQRMGGETGSVNLATLDDGLLDELSQLVVDVFSGQFTKEELENGADAAEMLPVLQQIAAMVAQGNPTPGRKGA